MWYRNLLEVIGKTPLVELSSVASHVRPTVVAKLEYFNPGNSVKDRIALRMVEDAERAGRLRPGGTIVESTSGNTGMGLALVAAIKGYRCMFTIQDKQSQEKVDTLRALGAEVVVCPTNVAPEDPRSYYSVARRLEKEIPNSCYVNQYDNLSNTAAHFETTGPEIWEQTDCRVTHMVCGMGTCGTISGIARYLKQKNPRVQSIGVDTFGSILKQYKEQGSFNAKEIYPYFIEGIGEDIIPENADFSVVDRIEKVSDRDALNMTRRLARMEGIFVGSSGGAAVVGALRVAEELSDGDLVVVLLPDHGSRYLGKVFNDNWMRSHGFLETEMQLTVEDILKRTKRPRKVISISPNADLGEAITLMKTHDVSQLPVLDGKEVVGAVTESKVLNMVLEDPSYRSHSVRTMMGDPFPFVTPKTRIDAVIKMITRETPAVLVRSDKGEIEVVSKYDLIAVLSE